MAEWHSAGKLTGMSFVSERRVGGKMRNTLMAVVAAGAMAVSTSAFGQAMVIIDEGGCGGLDGQGDGMLFDNVNKQQVVTPSGNVKLTCHGTNTGAPPPTNSAVLYDSESTGGGECDTDFGMTRDWHQVVTTSGRTTIVCHINFND